MYRLQSSYIFLTLALDSEEPRSKVVVKSLDDIRKEKSQRSTGSEPDPRADATMENKKETASRKGRASKITLYKPPALKRKGLLL